MPYNSAIHHRRSIRLRAYDYSQPGAYFVTICAHQRECIFQDGWLKAIVEQAWQAATTSSGRPPDEFVVMPNHVHGIIWIERDIVGAQQQCGWFPGSRRPARTSPCSDADRPVAAPLRRIVLARRRVTAGSLAARVRAFKSATAKRINNIRGTPGAHVWQRNYHEHVIRNEKDLARIREYILDNPRKWADGSGQSRESQRASP